MNKLPVKIENNKMPKNNFVSTRYEYKKRTSGGFADAIFLASLILTVGVWVTLLITVGGKW